MHDCTHTMKGQNMCVNKLPFWALKCFIDCPPSKSPPTMKGQLNSLECMLFFHKLKMNGNNYYSILLSFCHIKVDTLPSDIFLSGYTICHPNCCSANYLLSRKFNVSWLGKCPCMNEVQLKTGCNTQQNL